MQMEMEKVRAEKYYRIGHLGKIDKFVLVPVFTGIAWYERYYEISESEYELFDKDIAQLDELADKLRKAGTASERFLFSDLIAENTEDQHKLMDICFEDETK